MKNFEGITWYMSMLPGIRGKDEGAGVLEAAIYEIEELSEPPDFASSVSIDPELWEHVRRLVESEQWAQVASQTAIFIESKTRQWAGSRSASGSRWPSETPTATGSSSATTPSATRWAYSARGVCC